MNWYRLDVVRDTLRLDYNADLAPGVIGAHKTHLEMGRRDHGGELFMTPLNCESDELLVPQEQLLAAAESRLIKPARAFIESVKSRGGLWLGPSPTP